MMSLRLPESLQDLELRLCSGSQVHVQMARWPHTGSGGPATDKTSDSRWKSDFKTNRAVTLFFENQSALLFA
jgi:hypothetical protein